MDDNHLRLRTTSYAYPIVLSGGCDTGALLNWAPQHEYRGLNPDQQYHFFFYKDKKNIEEKIRNRKHSWPILVPPPHPYDFPSQANRTFACAWLFGSSTSGAIAYAGASLVQQGATYGGALFMRVLREAGKVAVLGDAWVQGQRDYIAEKLFLDDILGNPRIYLGIQTLFGDPSLRLTPVVAYGVSALMANERLTVFARTAHGTLTNKYYDSATSRWSDWVHLNEGQLSSGPSAILANERLTVFARNAHGTLTHKYWDTAKQQWSQWIHFEDGEISSGPSAVLSGTRLVVFARDLNGRLIHRFYDTTKQSWTSWIGIGAAKISSAPSAVVADQRLTVFARLTDRRLGHTYYDTQTGGWVEWTPVTDGEITSSPSALMAGKRLTVFARGTNGRLTHTFYDQPVGKWMPWKDLGAGVISSAPSAVMAGSRLTVFARAANGVLTHRFYDGGWSDWFELGDGAIT